MEPKQKQHPVVDVTGDGSTLSPLVFKAELKMKGKSVQTWAPLLSSPNFKDRDVSILVSGKTHNVSPGISNLRSKKPLPVW